MIKPIFDRVVLKQLSTQNTSSLYLSHDDNNNVAQVVAVGDVKTVKVGDKVVFNTFATTKVTDNKEQFLLIKEIDILGIIE